MPFSKKLFSGTRLTLMKAPSSILTEPNDETCANIHLSASLTKNGLLVLMQIKVIEGLNSSSVGLLSVKSNGDFYLYHIPLQRHGGHAEFRV